MKKYLLYFVKLTVSIVFVYLLFSKIHFESVYQTLKNISISYFLLGLLSFFICWIINSEKWRILLVYVGFDEKTFRLFKLNLISIFYASILPGGQLTGETIKCYKITRDAEGKGKLVFSVLMDRLTGLIAIIILGLIGIFFSNSEFGETNKLKYIFIILSLGSIALLVLYLSKALVLIKDKIENSQNKLSIFLLKIINVFLVYQGAYKTILISILYGLLFQFLNTLSVYLLATSISLDVSIFDLFWINAIVSIVLVVPITIMGLGLREGSFVLLLGFLGVTNSLALTVSLLVSFVYLLVGAIGGLIELYEFIKTKNNPA